MHSKSSLSLLELRIPSFFGKAVVAMAATLPSFELVFLCGLSVSDFVITAGVEPSACSLLPCLSSDASIGEASCVISCADSSFFAVTAEGIECIWGGGVGMGNALVAEMGTGVTRGLLGTGSVGFEVGVGVMRMGGVGVGRVREKGQEG